MKRNVKKAFLLIAGLALAFIFQSNSVFASVYEGSLCTGVNCPVEGTVIAAPTASPAAGSFTSAQSVTLTAASATSIRYTADGTTPTCASAQYSSAISVTSSKTIKAISCYANNASSTVASFAYTISIPSSSSSGGGGYTPPVTVATTTTATSTIPITTPTTATTPTTQTSSALIAAQTQLLNTLILQLQALLQQAKAAGISLPAGVESYLSVTAPSVTAVPYSGEKLSQTNRNLTVGSTGEDAMNLQKFLNAKGFTVAVSGPGSSGNETSMFGALTRTALAKFQASVGISPAVGYFGPVTRAYLESIGY